MIAIPAIDLREGACVQLVGGSFADERVRISDPVAVARHWAGLGFGTLHVVDLDAALGRGSNTATIADILRETTATIQIGGGVRSAERIDALLEAGASRVVVGTRALEDSAWLEEQASRHPGKLIVAADVREGQLAVRGWTATLDADLLETVGRLSALPLAGLLVTAVDVEGRMDGPALPLIRDVIAAASIPVIASGGITTLADLRNLAGVGAWGAVIGMALYTETLNAQTTAQEFGT